MAKPLTFQSYQGPYTEMWCRVLGPTQRVLLLDNLWKGHSDSRKIQCQGGLWAIAEEVLNFLHWVWGPKGWWQTEVTVAWLAKEATRYRPLTASIWKKEWLLEDEWLSVRGQSPGKYHSHTAVNQTSPVLKQRSDHLPSQPIMLMYWNPTLSMALVAETHTN